MRKLSAILLPIALFFAMTGCQQGNASGDAIEQKPDLINDTFPEAQAEIQEVIDETFQSLIDRDADKLISFHAYGPKFTHFKDGLPREGSEANEKGERDLVAAISGWEYDTNDLKINVFGEVAVVTYHADFRPTIGGEIKQLLNQATIVLVNTEQGWKITHEHFSPLVEE
ncbi:MAG: nuclear transport factor 2 family protein [Balneolaceae bacterium]